MSEALIAQWVDCDHLRLEPGGLLYRRDRVYLADQVDAAMAELEAELERVQSTMASEYEMDMNTQLRKVRELEARIIEIQTMKDEREALP